MSERDVVGPTPSGAALFSERGCLVIRQFIPLADLAALSEAFDQAVATATGRSSDHAGRLDAGPESLVTVVSPEVLVPALRDSRLAREAHRVFAMLFDVPESRVLCGWRSFLKPAGGGETPWHQDAAYRPPPHNGGTVWLPLDPATEESGCLEFLPGSHLGPLLGHSVQGHHLVTSPPGRGAAVSCPLELGDVSVHSCLTAHRAGPNRTSRPRRALAIVCQIRPVE
jgi:hypothetical protein